MNARQRIIDEIDFGATNSCAVILAECLDAAGFDSSIACQSDAHAFAAED